MKIDTKQYFETIVKMSKISEHIVVTCDNVTNEDEIVALYIKKN